MPLGNDPVIDWSAWGVEVGGFRGLRGGSWGSILRNLPANDK